MLYQAPYWYLLIEAPDVSLACYPTQGAQNWVLGMLRATQLQPTMGWEQLNNPTVVPIITSGCYIQYHRLFQLLDGTTMLEYWAADWMQLFQLVPGPGPHPIVAGPSPT